MSELTDAEKAERLSRQRAMLLSVLGILFVSQQALYFGKAAKFESFADARTVDLVHVGSWLLWAVMLLMVLATGGIGGSAAVRKLLDDESTREHRARALAIGFWSMTVAAIALYLLTLVEPVGGRLALHIVLTAGVGAALLRFGSLELRALKNG